MLRRAEPITIDDKNPFKNDKLGRSESAANLTQLIETLTQPFVLSVAGPWGCGKTTFVKMWMRSLRNGGHPCLYFNAWEHDFATDPLVALIGEMQASIDQHSIDLTDHPAAAEWWRKVKHIGAGALRRALPVAVRVATQGLLDVKQVQDALGSFGESGAIASFAEDLVKGYTVEKDAIGKFRQALGSLAEEVAKGGKAKPPMVFFIDELDRCRPTFAVELLERVKHLFSVPGIVFVLSIDRRQIESSLSALYGAGMDTDGYLRRFIDLEYRLPTLPMRDFCSHLYEHFHLDERVTRPDDREELLQLVSAFADLYEFSLRVAEQYFTRLNVVLRTRSRADWPSTALLLCLLALRVGRPPLYESYRRGTIGAEDVLSDIRGRPGGAEFLDGRRGTPVEGCLLSCSRSGDEPERARKAWMQICNDAQAPMERRDRANQLLQACPAHGPYAGTRLLDYTVAEIEFSERFAAPR